MVRDANCFHRFENGVFLHGLLVIPVMCLVNHYIMFFVVIVACLVVIVACPVKLTSVIRGQMSIENLVISVSVVHFIPPTICISYTNSGE
jgi:hypothetical protein